MIINYFQRKRQRKILEEIEAIEAGGLHGQLPVIWEKAKGAIVWDIFANCYIDFTSTIFVTNAGHGALEHAIAKQNRKLIHSYTFATETKWNFLKEFKKFLPAYCEKIFLASAGSEVTSWAVNLMRAYKGKSLIVHIDGAFHGKTGVVEQLSKEEIRIPFDGKDDVDIDNVRNALEQNKENIAGILIESYQGWSARFMNKDYISCIVGWAKRNDIPVCFDEIQGGFWRTGKKFAYEWYEVEPDLVCMGKGLGNGLPISALAGYAKYFNVPGLSSTHSGNPLCCAGAREAIKIYNKFSETTLESLHQVFLSRITDLKTQFSSVISEVNVHGLIGALIFNSTEQAEKVCKLCLDNGLLVVHTGRESIKLGPPLVITEKELDKGFNILKNAVQSI